MALALAPLRDPADRTAGLLVCARDASRQRRAELALGENRLALEQSREELRRLAVRFLGVEEEERRRLARELHDDLGQQIATLGFELGALRQGGAGGDGTDDARLALPGSLVVPKEPGYNRAEDAVT